VLPHPERLLLYGDYCSACMSQETFLISQGGSLLTARLTDNLRRAARKSAMRLKTQVSFLSFFLPSLLLALWHPTEQQLALQPVCRMEREKWKKKWEDCARGARLGECVKCSL